MAAEIDIRSLTLVAHHVNLYEAAGLKEEFIEPGFEADGRDVLGRPFFMDFSFNSAVLGDYVFPHEPLVKITNRKIIQETVLVGSDRRGTVKEHINAGDYFIEIKGILHHHDRKQYPVDQVRELKEFCMATEALEVTCDLLDIFDITKLVIKSWSIDNMMSQPYSQKYTIRCVSDEDFFGELTLDDLDGVRA